MHKPPRRSGRENRSTGARPVDRTRTNGHGPASGAAKISHLVHWTQLTYSTTLVVHEGAASARPFPRESGMCKLIGGEVCEYMTSRVHTYSTPFCLRVLYINILFPQCLQRRRQRINGTATTRRYCLCLAGWLPTMAVAISYRLHDPLSFLCSAALMLVCSPSRT